MLQSTEFWVAVAFLILLGVGLYFGLRPILAMIDQRAARIRREIDEAEQLREEAQQRLADFKRKQREAQREAEEIIEHAKAEAKRMRDHGVRDLEAQIKRREQLTLEKIEQAERRAINEVRDQAVDVALIATEGLLRDILTDTRASALIDEAIADVSKRLH